METVGNRIKRLRLTAELSQQDVATRIGVSRVAVTKWESGQTANMKLDNLTGLCNLFNITIEYLINGEKPGDKPLKFLSKREIQVNEITNNLNDPDFDDEDVEITKSVVARIKAGKKDKKNHRNGNGGSS